MATLLQDLESGVVDMLTPLVVAGFLVEVLPEEKDGIEVAVERPKITVAYRESTYDEAKPNYAGMGNAVAQEEFLHIDIIIRARTRTAAGIAHDQAGVYAAIDAVRVLLFGKKPIVGARPFRFTGQRLETFESLGNWRYSLSLVTSYLIVTTDPLESGVINSLFLYWHPEGPATKKQILPAQ